MNKDNLGARMKGYEHVPRAYLTKRMPAIIRIDGKAFHNFTKGFKKPFDKILIGSMWETAKYLCANTQGCKLAYTQSDEISLLLTDYESIRTASWFDKNIQKMASISASMATMSFNQALFDVAYGWKENEYLLYQDNRDARLQVAHDFSLYCGKAGFAMFDSRVFVLPKEEVCNYFIWRQQDATRNAIQMIGQANFSHNELQKLNQNQVQEKLFQEKNINFNDFPIYQKRGACIIKENYLKDGIGRTRWTVDSEIPIFTQDRNYIERFI